MNSTLALIINVPTLFLLYILTYFTQALSGKRQFYGISLNSDYFNKDEFKNLDKKYKFNFCLRSKLIFKIRKEKDNHEKNNCNDHDRRHSPLTDCLQQFVRLRPVPFFQRNILRQHGRRCN